MQFYQKSSANILFLLYVPGTIVGIHARILIRMRLNGVWIKNLEYLAEIDLLHQVVDVIVIVVMRKNQQHLGDVLGLCQTHDQVTQIGNPGMNLQRYIYV